MNFGKVDDSNMAGVHIELFLSLNSSIQCVRFQSQRTLFNQLGEERTKIAAIGSGCTLATEPSAEISHFWNIPQVCTK